MRIDNTKISTERGYNVKNKITKQPRVLSENSVYYILLIPFMSTFLVFNILPVLSSIVLSLFDFDMVSLPIFVGLDNYSRMLTNDPLFFKVLGTTFKFAIVSGPVSYLLAFILAWMINEFPRTVRVLLTFIFYVPALIGGGLTIWEIMFSGDSYAYANNILISFGLITEPIQWFQDPAYNFTIILVIQLWMSMGVSFLSNMAGLQNVNVELYEAGAIDGIRTRWHELWYITLPTMKSILLFSAVMQIQSVFSAGGVMQALAGYPSVNNSVDTFVTFISDMGTTRYEMGYASALSVILFLIILAIRYMVGFLLNLIGKSDR